MSKKKQKRQIQNYVEEKAKATRFRLSKKSRSGKNQDHYVSLSKKKSKIIKQKKIESNKIKCNSVEEKEKATKIRVTKSKIIKIQSKEKAKATKIRVLKLKKAKLPRFRATTMKTRNYRDS